MYSLIKGEETGPAIVLGEENRPVILLSCLITSFCVRLTKAHVQAIVIPSSFWAFSLQSFLIPCLHILPPLSSYCLRTSFFMSLYDANCTAAPLPSEKTSPSNRLSFFLQQSFRPFWSESLPSISLAWVTWKRVSKLCSHTLVSCCSVSMISVSQQGHVTHLRSQSPKIRPYYAIK